MPTLSLVKTYSTKTMWTCILLYLFSTLPALQSTTVGPVAMHSVQSFLLFPALVSVGWYLSLTVSSQEDHISRLRLLFCSIVLLSIIGVFLFL